MSGACSSIWDSFFGWHTFVSMRCGPALLGSHTFDIHNTAHETTTQDTRSTRPQHADVTTHHKQHSKITTSCSSLISPLLSMSSRVSTLHIVLRSRTASRLVTVPVFARRSVLFWLMVRSWVHPRLRGSLRTYPLASSDWSFAYDCGVLRALWLTASAVSGFSFLFSVWFHGRASLQRVFTLRD